VASVLALAQSGGDGGPRVLRPANQALLPPGPLTAVARGPGPLRLDGKAVTAKSAAGAVWAGLTLAPGAHELAIGDHVVRFFVGPGAPAGYRPYRVHPPAETACETCHAVRDGIWEFQGAATSCFTCHDRQKFPAGHTHNPEVLGECGLCHDPHGSAEKFHLKLPRDTACKQCHA
jgi:predicted CXXCH cytochrome family protein